MIKYDLIMASDPDKFSLMEASLEVYGSLASPEYTDVQERLAGHLATSATLYTDLRAEIASEKDNYQMVQEFIGHLPLQTETKYGSVFEHLHDNYIATDDPYVAKQIGSHVLWTMGEAIVTRDISPTDNKQTEDKRFKGGLPYYIVGQKLGVEIVGGFRQRGVQVSDLLLVEASPRKTIGTPARVRTDDYMAVRDEAQASTHRDYTEAELRRLMDPDTGMIKLTRNSAYLKLGLQLPTDYKSRPFSIGKAHKLNELLYSGIPRIPGYSPKHEGRLPDRILGQLGVSTALNQLAVAFQKEEVLTGIYTKYKAKAA